jgi:SOS-response transcriptional repressor LexA
MNGVDSSRRFAYRRQERASLKRRYLNVLSKEENRSPDALFVRIVGNSMSGVLENGYAVRVDKSLTDPADGDVVAVYITGEGGLVGYWRGGERPMLEKANPACEPVDLDGKGMPWRIVGTVTHIVDAPLRGKN